MLGRIGPTRADRDDLGCLLEGDGMRRRGVQRFTEDSPPIPFHRERFQVASRDHLCHDCRTLIPFGLSYRVTVWKLQRGRFNWKKNHEVCSMEEQQAGAACPEEVAAIARTGPREAGVSEWSVLDEL